MTKLEVPQNTIIGHLRRTTKYLTSTDVLAILPITRATLCKWCRASKLPHFRLPDHSYIFDPVQLADWMLEREIA